ncbi:Fibropellin-3 [Holothuria leucospilota]|uniref:Fibropellin-3 n=1 Tax=Holothuria leucospilota TaxID=206669 RepID=A0A9Q1C333_HOLLE|nr:Fibropellin-3 [Holothuria leucospilota]
MKICFRSLSTDAFSDAERCFNWPNDCSTASFFSPNFPEPYPSQLRKLYQIFVPTATAITLVFNSPFEVEEKDTVFIGAGFQLPEDLEISSAIGDSFSFSGNQAPVSLTLESDVVWILFETDSSSELRGWFVQWSATTNPCVWEPCLNGGVCIPNFQANTYSCTCTSCFFGERCEFGKCFFFIAL